MTKFVTNLPYKELKETQKIVQKLKTMELVLVYFILFNKIAITTSFVAFFRVFSSKFSLLDPDPYPGRKMNAAPDP